ncbi:MAG: dihydroorotate dehydrogenase electron transfer subunit [candidate division Zixibacteria bacterium]|nr:dihydroorotate dehydrogenase electron transfer subunit [candidate division Zixibacteria bacterium]
MLYQLSTPVLSNERLQEKVFKLTLSSPLISRISKPGHFVHARVSSGYNPLFRRAFSIHSLDKNEGSFEILFRVIGKGTEILSQVYPGDALDVLGPIGNSFSLPKKGQKITLVAGGMGIAPLWFLFNHLVKRFHKDELTFFVGAKSKGELLYIEKLASTGANLTVATDDGSAGRKGLITEVFAKEIKGRGSDYRRLCVYSCGPQMMLRRMSQLAKRLDFLCQISLETHMACGVGACWGCVVKLQDGTYKRVCVDGPVFDARDVDLV